MAFELENSAGCTSLYLFDPKNENMSCVTGFSWDPMAKAFEISTDNSPAYSEQITVAHVKAVIASAVEAAGAFDAEDPRSVVLDSPILDEYENSIVDIYAMDDACLLVSFY